LQEDDEDFPFLRYSRIRYSEPVFRLFSLSVATHFFMFFPKREIHKKIWYRKEERRNGRKGLLPNLGYRRGSGKEPP
jgi:hypothetical protein